MAIRVDYGNIGDAVRLGKRAGEGDEFRFRFAAGQELVQNALRQRQLGEQQRATTIQSALAQQELGVRSRESKMRESRLATETQSHMQAQGREQALREQKFEFEKGQFAETLALRQREVGVEEKRETRLGEGITVSDPTKDPAFRAMDELASGYISELSKMQRDLAAMRASPMIGPADIAQQEARIQSYYNRPIPGSRMNVGDLLAARETYLASTIPQATAAAQSQWVARELKREENARNEVVNTIATRLPKNATKDDIGMAVYAEVGNRASPEVMAEIANEVERKIRSGR